MAKRGVIRNSSRRSYGKDNSWIKLLISVVVILLLVLIILKLFFPDKIHFSPTDNILKNGDFNSAVSTDGTYNNNWALFKGANQTDSAIIVNNSDPHFLKFVQITGYGFALQNVNLSKGKNYNLSMEISANAGAKPIIWVQNSTWAAIVGIYPDASAGLLARQYSRVFTVPQNGIYKISLGTKIEASGRPEMVWYDNALLYEMASTPVCGNGIIEGNEQCDGSAFGGVTCASRGYHYGNLGCTSVCTYDNSCTDCFDSDGGSTSVKGNATAFASANGSANVGVDQCLSPTLLREFACYSPGTAYSNSITSYNVTCPGGCLNGACTTSNSNISTCTDSDGGLNYYLNGTVTLLNNSAVDSCSSNLSLVEFYCSSNSTYGAQTYYCPSGVCSNGACVGNSTNVTSVGVNNTYSGSNITIIGSNNTVISNNTVVYSNNSYTMGSNITIIGYNDTVIGYNVSVYGSNNTMIGSNISVIGNNNTIYRNNSRSVINNSRLY